MKIIGHFGSYAAAAEHAKNNGLTGVSIQHLGQGWQKHKWTLIQL